MHSSRYQQYVLKSLIISRQWVSNVHECPFIKSVSIQICPMSLDQSRLLRTTSLLIALSGRHPRQLIKQSRRSKERYVSGAVVTLRGSYAVDFISSFGVLSLFYSANFRGFKQTLPNESSSLCPRHLSFFLGARRAFDTGLLGFEDNGLFCHIITSFSKPDYSGTCARGLRLPIYS